MIKFFTESERWKLDSLFNKFNLYGFWPDQYMQNQHDSNPTSPHFWALPLLERMEERMTQMKAETNMVKIDLEAKMITMKADFETKLKAMEPKEILDRLSVIEHSAFSEADVNPGGQYAAP